MSILYKRVKALKWNLNKIKFLYPPDSFTGSFANEKMQARHRALMDEKINVILKNLENADDPMAALKVLNRLDQIQFLINNRERFKVNNCLEEAILRLYCRKNSAFESDGQYDVWLELFSQCDAEKFYALGSSFPDRTILGFRGSVAGVVEGFSWTINQKTIDWFKERWQDKELGGGTIFSTHISRKDILIYLNDKEQEEMIVSPQFLKTAEIIPL